MLVVCFIAVGLVVVLVDEDLDGILLIRICAVLVQNGVCHGYKQVEIVCIPQCLGVCADCRAEVDGKRYADCLVPGGVCSETVYGNSALIDEKGLCRLNGSVIFVGCGLGKGGIIVGCLCRAIDYNKIEFHGFGCGDVCRNMDICFITACSCSCLAAGYGCAVYGSVNGKVCNNLVFCVHGSICNRYLDEHAFGIPYGNEGGAV